MVSLKLTYAKTLEKPVKQKFFTRSGKRANKRVLICLFALIFVYTLSGCVTLPDPETTQDFSADTVAVINPEQSVGQRFLSRREQFNGIDLWFAEDSADQWVKVELFHTIGDPAPLYTGNFYITGGKNRIKIEAGEDAPGQTYYLRLSVATGEAQILGRNEDVYPQGSAYINDQPIDADLAFRATYAYKATAAMADLRDLFSIGWLLPPLGILLLLPGWLLLDFSGFKDAFDRGEKIALSLGLSLVSVPVWMLWCSLIGLRWSRISVWLVASLLIIALIWRQFKASQRTIKETQTKTQITPKDINPAENRRHPASLPPHSSPFIQHPSISHHAAFILLICIFVLTLFIRFAMVRDLAAPAWVDPIHHGLITRLILENGGLPDTYDPYLPLEADYYHFGYHSLLSTFIWLTDLEIHTAMLIFGQVLNALIIFAVYLLAKTLTENRAGALTAALIAGLFTLMPAYYISWGRYTQLTGLLVLPTAFTLIVKTTKSETLTNSPKKLWLLTIITCAGLFLIHYRVTAFLGALILAYLFAQKNLKDWPRTINQMILLGIGSAALLLPWLPGTIINLLVPKGQTWNGGEASFSQIPWNYLRPGLGEAALILAGIGLVLGLIRLKRFPITIILWAGLMYLLANLGVLGLAGAGFVNPVSMEITLFMPMAVLSGFAVGGILELLDKWLPIRWQALPRLIFTFLGVGSAILGAQRLLPTNNPITFLARYADFQAIQWIDEHIPASETILINPTGWGYGLYMGNDGGYWISALTRHQTMPPPVLYGLGDEHQIAQINDTVQRIQRAGEDAEALWTLMQAENIHFVYIGARGGILSPWALAQSDLFEIRYQRDGTWLFETVQNMPFFP